MTFAISHQTNAPVQFTDDEQKLLCDILHHIKGAPLNDNVAEFFWESYEEMDSDEIFASIIKKVSQTSIIRYE